MLILASASPRRRDLLARLGLPFDVVAPEIDESALTGRPERVARRLAAGKARPVSGGRPHPPAPPAPRATMRRNTDAETAPPTARGDPFDKAGAYAIQDERLDPVACWGGCY